MNGEIQSRSSHFSLAPLPLDSPTSAAGGFRAVFEQPNTRSLFISCEAFLSEACTSGLVNKRNCLCVLIWQLRLKFGVIQPHIDFGNSIS